MRELFLLNGCACLAYLAVALLVSWVIDDWRDTSTAKLLIRRMNSNQRVVFMEPEGLPALAPLPKRELAATDLSVPLIP